MAASDFSALPLSAEFIDNIRSLGYDEMTPIQTQGLPLILSGQDLLAQAATGSGKTAAFAIGLLNKLNVTDYVTQGLVICPTRELADQVTHEIRRLARSIPNIKISTLCGGKPMGPQLASLERNPHVAVGTPGRLLKLLEKRALKLDKVETLVLDEADRMLEMGFQEDIKKIIKRCPDNRQTLLFSATYPDEIRQISDTIQTDPKEIRLQSLEPEPSIKQLVYSVANKDRTEVLIAALQRHKPTSCLIFCTTRLQCQEITRSLQKKEFKAQALHGDLEQFDRDQVLVQFANHSVPILVATDVAARGLDIKDLGAVINYELPFDPEMHVHRIGRTGRAGKVGLAVSLVATDELPRLAAITEYSGVNISINDSGLKAVEGMVTPAPPMITLFIHGGRKNKLRAGDILGGLTADPYLPGNKIGKIDIFDTFSYVAVERGVGKQALKILSDGKLKGKKFRVRLLDGD